MEKGGGKPKGHVALEGFFQKSHDWLRGGRGSKFSKNWLRGFWMAPKVKVIGTLNFDDYKVLPTKTNHVGFCLF